MTSVSTWSSRRRARGALAAAAVGAALLGMPGAAGALDEEGCLGCHGLPHLAVRDAGKARPLSVDEEDFGRSAHAEVGCRECHADIASIPHAGAREASCGQPCHGKTLGGKSYSHEGLYWEFAASSHGKAGARKVGCLACHPTPGAAGSGERDKLAEARRCAACHRGSEKVMAWFQDRHFAALAGGNRRAPSCPDCHSTHRVHPASVPESTVHPRRLAETCSSGALGGERRGGCHGNLGPAAVEGASMSPLPRGGRGRGAIPAALTVLAGLLFAGLAARAGAGLLRGR